MAKFILPFYIASTSLALILLKLGSRTAAPIAIANGKLNLNLNAQVIAGILLYGISFTLYTYLISVNDLGYIIPVTTALVYIIIFTASFVIFREAFTVLKIIGISMIVIGVILLNLKK